MGEMFFWGEVKDGLLLTGLPKDWLLSFTNCASGEGDLNSFLDGDLYELI